jgi:hypothetical protein
MDVAQRLEQRLSPPAEPIWVAWDIYRLQLIVIQPTRSLFAMSRMNKYSEYAL